MKEMRAKWASICVARESGVRDRFRVAKRQTVRLLRGRSIWSQGAIWTRPTITRWGGWQTANVWQTVDAGAQAGDLGVFHHHHNVRHGDGSGRLVYRC